ncbi:MAG: hypothetical protein E7627_02120 [Ruminococcaceae bacterium]|nr:hypothetical protein [Oscillospiraceae bacterium]
MKRKNYDGSEYIDRPDLNKCPDCGCYFGGQNCPLCGKPCPEEMKAGNRKPEAKPKPQKVKVVGSFAWYHTWWFIAVMMFISPVIGIILLATSPRKTWVKILVSLLIISPYIILIATTYGSLLFIGLSNKTQVPVDTSLTRTEYIEACDEVDVEAFYRDYSEYAEDYVALNVIVEEKITDSNIDSFGSEYNVYYLCSPVGGGDYKILVRDCVQSAKRNYISGDVITVYGEGAGQITVYGMGNTPVSAPCVYAAHIDVEK